MITSASKIAAQTDLLPFIRSNPVKSCNRHIRGVIVVPGGGGKTTLVENRQSKDMVCVDIDQYWDQQQEPETIEKLVAEWKEACQDNQNRARRHQIEEQYVLLKARLCADKWSKEENARILFVQTPEQAAILLDENCYSMHLAPTDRLHRRNLLCRAKARVISIDDFDVCRRQWLRIQEQSTIISYDNFQELGDLLQLFHQFLLFKEKSIQ